jgi:hypothetical protein
LASARTLVDAISHLLSPLLPPALAVVLSLSPFSSLPLLLPTALVPARVRTHSIDITPVANGHPPPSDPRIKRHHGLPPLLSRCLCSPFRRTKHGKNKCLIFMLYMIKVANTFLTYGVFLSFFFVFSFLWCLELQTVVKVYDKGQAKAKQSEGFCE